MSKQTLSDIRENLTKCKDVVSVTKILHNEDFFKSKFEFTTTKSRYEILESENVFFLRIDGLIVNFTNVDVYSTIICFLDENKNLVAQLSY